MRSAFRGFPKEAFEFLRSLERNNTRDWFQPRKEIYENSVRAPMSAFIEALNVELVQFAPRHIADPRKAIYRIYRDTRFSKDKTPYKTHIAASFNRAGLEKHVSAGFYFSVSPKEIEVAGGVYMPGPDQLRAIRRYLEAHHEEFRATVENRSVRKLLGELWGEPMARVPKGFSPDHPAADLIKRKNWVLYDTRLDPKLALTPKLLTEVVKRFKAMTPFIDALNGPLSARRARDPLFG